MILGDPQMAAATTPGARVTLDDLFRRATQRNPDMLALVDPPNRASFTDGAPRSLTYAQADRMISAVAERLHKLRLPADAIVGIQLPNTVESVLTLLGVLRAGMIAAPLPLLWRRSELVKTLSNIDAKALITCHKVGDTDHAALAMHAAAAIFPIRYVCAFGSGLPDGVVALDELFDVEKPQPPELDRARADNRAAHLAVITWDAAADSMVPVARSHAETIGGGLAVLLEGRFENGSTFLSTLPQSSFAGLAITVLPWLISGGTLMLHHSFDPETLALQLHEGCDAAVLPAPVLPNLADAGLLANARTVISFWRAPEQMNNAPAWRENAGIIVDVACFGETCIIPARRGESRRPAPIPLGIVTAPREGTGAVLVAEATCSGNQSLALSGPMVPRHAYPPGAERSNFPHYKTVNGVVDTGHPCRIDEETQTIIVMGPAAGIAEVGGYRFGLQHLEKLVGNIGKGGHVTTLPDPISGLRLVGFAEDKAALHRALIKQSVNPLVVDAFA
jgi:AMP-binding enzyme